MGYEDWEKREVVRGVMWQRRTNGEGHVYFRNEDGEVRWDDPKGEESSEEVKREVMSGSGGGWVYYKDPGSGHGYYYNEERGESVWEEDWGKQRQDNTRDQQAPRDEIEEQFQNMLATKEGRVRLDREVMKLEEEEQSSGVAKVVVTDTLWGDVKALTTTTMATTVAMIPQQIRAKAGIELPYSANDNDEGEYEDDEESGSSSSEEEGSEEEEDDDIEQGGDERDSSSSSSSDSDESDSDSDDEVTGNIVTRNLKRGFLTAADALQPVYDGTVNRAIRVVNESTPATLFYALGDVLHGVVQMGAGGEEEGSRERDTSTIDYGGEVRESSGATKKDEAARRGLPPPPFFQVGAAATPPPPPLAAQPSKPSTATST